MTHYNYNVKSWEKQKQNLFYFSIKELMLEIGYPSGSPRDGSNDGKTPYVEMEEETGRVRVRRTTHLSKEQEEELIQRVDKIYTKVRRMQGNKIKKEIQDFWKRNEHRKTEIGIQLRQIDSDLEGTPFEKLSIHQDEGDIFKDKNPIVGEDGKVEMELELDKPTHKKLKKLSEKFHKPEGEVVEDVITEHFDKIKEGKVCCLCGKDIKDMGNNPKPLKDEGRCCNDCNTYKVIPEREKNPNWRELSTIKEVERINDEVKSMGGGSILDMVKKNKNKALQQKIFGCYEEEFDIEKLYEHYNLPVEDRLKNFQVLNNFFRVGVRTNSELDILFYQYFVNPVISAPEEKKKAYNIDDDLAEKIMKRKNYPETLLPFPSTIIDCALPVEDRFYIGFICGRFYFDKPYLPYTGVISCFTEKVGEDCILKVELIILEKEAEEMFRVKKDKYYKKVKNFIYGVLGFIHEPDVSFYDHPLNPKNNQRRIERGRLPLPSFIVIKITGKKKVYLEKHNSLPSQPRNFNFQQDVKSSYIHFWNKKKYKRLYQLYDEDRQECLSKGYEWYPPKNVLRKKKKGFTRFKDKPRRNVSYVLEDERYKEKTETPKQVINQHNSFKEEKVKEEVENEQ